VKSQLTRLFFYHFSEHPESVRPLRGDGSDRHYYRLSVKNHSVIGVFGANSAENEAFLTLSRHFRNHGLPVPEIYCSDLAKNIYLEQDLGDTTLISWLVDQRVQHGFTEKAMDMYRAVLHWLPHFQIRVGRSLDYTFCYQHSDFGYDSMMWDVNYFKQRFLKPFYRNRLDETALQLDLERLIRFLMEEKAVFFLYRDFQSRNIMIHQNGPYFLDYQSGRKGALQYDVASLLYDAKAQIPEESRQQLLSFYLDEVERQFVVKDTGSKEKSPAISHRFDRTSFLHHFDGFVLIRMMQALGAFGYLSLVKKKRQFLAIIPLALKNAAILLKRQTILDRLKTLQSVFVNLVDDESLKGLNSESDINGISNGEQLL
jgi:aminoglycoside/choline kinase family phosphotransferase